MSSNEPAVFSGDFAQGRKRRKRADKTTWRRQKNSKLRMQGAEYTGFESVAAANGSTKYVQSKQKSARLLGPTCSSIQCAKSKSTNCDKFTGATRQELFQQFWENMDWGQKKAYVGSLVDIVETKRKSTNRASRRSNSMIYYLKLSDTKVQVCRHMFLSTLGISEKRMRNWSGTNISGIPQVSPPRPKVRVLNNANLSAKEFLEVLPKMPSHYCRASSTKMYLEPDINSKKQLYQIYKVYCQSKQLQVGSPYQLNKVFEDNNYGLFSPKKDQCDTCCSYKVGQVTEENYKDHVAKKTAAREEKFRDKSQASEGKCHVITMDVESVKLSPMLKASALYYKTKLVVHNFTIYDLTSHHASCYWWDESEGDLVASTFASCLVDYLEKKYQDDLPIIIYSDGCANQNRNAMMSNALLQISISTKKNITQKFLEKGHTQMECDSVHSSIEAELKHKVIYLPRDYIKISENARVKQPYETLYLDHSFFKDYSMKKNQRYYSIRPGTKVGDPCVTDLRAIKYDPSGVIHYKLDHRNPHWTELPNLPKKLITQEYPPLYSSRRKITDRKYKDLQDLKVVIPNEYHDYYNNLLH